MGGLDRRRTSAADEKVRCDDCSDQTGMDCPKCKIVNPGGSLTCDCGYNFGTGYVGKSSITSRSESAAYRVVGTGLLILGCAVVGGAIWIFSGTSFCVSVWLGRQPVRPSSIRDCADRVPSRHFMGFGDSRPSIARRLSHLLKIISRARVGALACTVGGRIRLRPDGGLRSGRQTRINATC